MSKVGRRVVGVLGRALHRLVHPEYAQERAHLEAIASLVTKTASAQRDQVSALQGELARLSALLDRHATQKDIRGLERGLAEVRASARRHYRVTAQALKHANWLEEQRVVERRLANRLARLAASGRPLLVGPWSGEVGFELLYWIPFVNWIVENGSLARDRLIVVSRGGAAPWYRHIGGRYIDILSHFSPDEFRASTELAKKQKTLGAFDRQVVRRVMQAAGIRHVDLLHPGLMYRLFRPFWKQQATVRRIEAYTSHRALPRPHLADLNERLPPEYVAVRFYFSQCFPDSPSNRAFVGSVLKTLAQMTHVVLLNTSFHVDDHHDYLPDGGDRVHRIDDLMPPERNLEVQTAVISRARAFVGTYGGYSYLAPLCGVSSLAFYSDKTFFAHHLELAQRVFGRLSLGASLVPLDVKDMALIELALGARAGAPGPDQERVTVA